MISRILKAYGSTHLISECMPQSTVDLVSKMRSESEVVGLPQQYNEGLQYPKLEVDAASNFFGCGLLAGATTCCIKVSYRASILRNADK